MGDSFIGEIRMFAGNFAPLGWAYCNGAILPISEYDALFSLIGTTYGGDGQTTFALPNLQGRVPVHQGNGHWLAEEGGVEAVTLTVPQIPAHSHTPMANSGGTTGKKSSPANAVWNNNGQNQYDVGPAGTLNAMRANAVQPTGGSQPHDNMQPYLVVNFIIRVDGIYPSQT